jgi:hypothetical protein
LCFSGFQSEFDINEDGFLIEKPTPKPEAAVDTVKEPIHEAAEELEQAKPAEIASSVVDSTKEAIKDMQIVDDAGKIFGLTFLQAVFVLVLVAGAVVGVARYRAQFTKYQRAKSNV